MKRSMFVFLSLLVIAALSACAPQGTPTPSLADLQATAMANAQAQLALTAAAIPTATQLPPTPEPTPIPVLVTEVPQQPVVIATEVLPVLPVIIPTDAVVVASATSDNPCTEPLSKMKGPHVDVTFTNKTKGDLSLYLYNFKTVFGCGVGNVSLAPFESVTTSVPKACYDFYGWVTGPKNSTPEGYGCLEFDQSVTVLKDSLVFNNQTK